MENIKKFIEDLEEINNSTVKFYGNKSGKKINDYFLKTINFRIRTRIIEYEFDDLLKLYDKHIFAIINNFYQDKYREILKDVPEIEKVPKHAESDKISLLFYVSLYHKLENYENEVIEFFNNHSQKKRKLIINIDPTLTENKTLFADRNRIRLISNSIKHNDFFPKPDLLLYYPELSIKRKLKLQDFNPQEDVSLIKNFIKKFNLILIYNLFNVQIKESQLHDYNLTENLAEWYDKFKMDHNEAL